MVNINNRLNKIITGLDLNNLTNNALIKQKLLLELSENVNPSKYQNFRFIEKSSLEMVFNLLNNYPKKDWDDL